MNLVLTPAEQNHPIWIKLVEAMKEELAILRAKNDSPSLDATKTAALRGEINALKKLLVLDEAQPNLE